ncbi:MAG: hypothetical protein KAG66_00175, partial [Methylococcales bacterium]|nr:hypothetical protein [Methylococcales bacterium]
QELTHWANTHHQLKLRVIHAQGGMGKTRFAFELADQLRQQGWQAGEMPNLDSRATWHLGNKGLLLIIDYPEEKGSDISTLIDDLAQLELPENARLRILLVSRRAELPELPGKLEANYDPAYELKPLDTQNSHSNNDAKNHVNNYAWALFQSASRAMQKLQQQGEQQSKQQDKKQGLISEQQFQDWLASDALHTRPLFILAFARHLIDSPEQTRLQGANIIKALVQRETRRLRQEAEKKGLDADAIMLLKALAGISGGINRTTLEKLHATPDPDVKLPKLNATLTQSTLWDDDSHSIPALEPDLLAAELLQSELDKEHLQAGKWLYQVISIRSDDDDDNASANDNNSQQQALERLIRLISDERNVLKNQQNTAPITALQDYVRGHSERCKALKTLLYMKNPTQILLPLAITVSQQTLQDCDDPEQQALILNNLSVSLAGTGERQQGLKAIQRAVKIYE